jgi:hypothetical protein
MMRFDLLDCAQESAVIPAEAQRAESRNPVIPGLWLLDSGLAAPLRYAAPRNDIFFTRSEGGHPVITGYAYLD